ncbi:hypothetical protein EXIGLDRAFT_9362 [Exidia glandulosa HHB12029]|uniref:IMD domain-containing protein n=1 Tax=Exidia glandulosa HHB12029 TaxID=1314781 RepID=A0A165QQW2_EXIGL|nr:hypothetical protein EXIGLDRAFT_9362 [Exidia glandulosa HHB12029]
MRRSLSVATNGRARSTGPPSPTLTATTNASVLDLGQAGPQRIITRGDLRGSAQAYNELINAATAFRTALSAMSKASATFAHATEKCSRLKGAGDESAGALQSSSGLFYVIANHVDVLGSSIQEKFEKPLRQHFDTYRAVVDERSNSYERALHEKSRQIRQTELENMQSGRKRQRDLQTFRVALAKLQSQVDDLDRMKIDHYQSVYEHEEETWDYVMGKVAVVVKAELDIADRVAAKLTDPSLEPILHATPDPFESYAAKSEDEIYSILPPLGILSASSTTSLGDSSQFLDVKPERRSSLEDSVQSWRGEVSTPATETWSDTRTPHSSPPPTIRRHDGAKIRTSLVSVSEASFGPPPTKEAQTSVPSSPRSMIHQRARSPLSFSADAFSTDDRSTPDRVYSPNSRPDSFAASESTSQTPSLISDTTSRGV